MSVVQPGRSSSPPPTAMTRRDALGSVWTDLGDGRWRSHAGEVMTPGEVVARYGPVTPAYQRPHGVRGLITQIAGWVRRHRH